MHFAFILSAYITSILCFRFYTRHSLHFILKSVRGAFALFRVSFILSTACKKLTKRFQSSIVFSECTQQIIEGSNSRLTDLSTVAPRSSASQQEAKNIVNFERALKKLDCVIGAD